MFITLTLTTLDTTSGAGVFPNTAEQGMNGANFFDDTVNNMPFRLQDDENETFIFAPSEDDSPGKYRYTIKVYYAGPNNPTYEQDNFEIEVTGAITSGSDEEEDEEEDDEEDDEADDEADDEENGGA